MHYFSGSLFDILQVGLRNSGCRFVDESVRNGVLNIKMDLSSLSNRNIKQKWMYFAWPFQVIGLKASSLLGEVGALKKNAEQRCDMAASGDPILPRKNRQSICFMQVLQVGCWRVGPP